MTPIGPFSLSPFPKGAQVEESTDTLIVTAVNRVGNDGHILMGVVNHLRLAGLRPDKKKGMLLWVDSARRKLVEVLRADAKELQIGFLRVPPTMGSEDGTKSPIGLALGMLPWQKRGKLRLGSLAVLPGGKRGLRRLAEIIAHLKAMETKPGMFI